MRQTFWKMFEIIFFLYISTSYFDIRMNWVDSLSNNILNLFQIFWSFIRRSRRYFQFIFTDHFFYFIQETEYTGCFTGDAVFYFAWSVIFLYFVSTWTDWGLLRLHSEIFCEWRRCLRKIVGTKDELWNWAGKTIIDITQLKTCSEYPKNKIWHYTSAFKMWYHYTAEKWKTSSFCVTSLHFSS